METININGVILKRIRFISGSNITIYLSQPAIPKQEIFQFAEFFRQDRTYSMSDIELRRQTLKVQEDKRQAEIRIQLARKKLEAAQQKLKKVLK